MLIALLNWVVRGVTTAQANQRAGYRSRGTNGPISVKQVWRRAVNQIQPIRACVSNDVTSVPWSCPNPNPLTHPIVYDIYDLCDYVKEEKLNYFTVSTLKEICTFFELPFKSRDSKAVLMWKKRKWPMNASAQLKDNYTIKQRRNGPVLLSIMERL